MPKPSPAGHRVVKQADFPPGDVAIVDVAGRSVGVYNCDGELFGVRNACPHHGAPLCLGAVSGTMLPSAPQEYEYAHDGLIVRCPWHGWEFDLRTGRSLFEPDRWRVRTYEVRREDGWIVVVP